MQKFLKVTLEDQVALIEMDMPGEEMNIISLSLLDEFLEVFHSIQQNNKVKAAVIFSAKRGFMAGADIRQFLEMKAGEALKAAREGHYLFREIEKSPKPFVAAIHGACMGGGTELSLACAGRVLSSDSTSMMALPEVKLGLLPGLGGTIRLPKLVGIQKALDMMLTGKNIFAYPALKMGLVDQLVVKEKLMLAAKKLALDLADKKFKRKDKRPTTARILESGVFRSIVFNQANKMVLRSTQGNYPAPLKIIESVKYNTKHPFDACVQHETELFDKLLQGDISYQLIHLFFAITAMKKNPWANQVKPVRQLAVLGAGLMGEGIAEVSMQKVPVMLKDINQDMLQQASKRIYGALDKKVKRRIITKSELELRVNSVMTTLNYEGFQKVDMVIEAVFEDLSLKHRVLKEVEAQTNSSCIFASNTSALPISKIAEKSSRPELVIGMHYFSPVQKMPLLEIIVTEKTAEWVKATALAMGIQQGKTCIVVNDGPGFYTTRILAPFMNEALLLIEEGVDPVRLERIMKKFGFPVGPITLMDEVGIDVGAHITEGDLGQFFESRGAAASPIMKALAEAGFKGRKNKKGFWTYDAQGKKIRGKINPEIYKVIKQKEREISDQEISDRMSMIMLNEAAHCLSEKILLSARDGDIGAVFGLGFPPFTGGPFRYMDALGLDKVFETLKKLEQKNGARFAPAPDIEKMAMSNKHYH